MDLLACCLPTFLTNKEAEEEIMKKLIVKEFVIDGTEERRKIGEKYSFFQDPETGKYYEPVEGFTVESDIDLSDRFREVPD